MTMQKEKRRSPKRRKQQLLMMVGEEVGQNDQKCPGARRSSAAFWRAPRILLPQGYSRVNSSTKSSRITPKASICLLLEIHSSRFSRRTLRFAPTNLWLLGCLAPTCCGKNPGTPASFEWCRKDVMSITTKATAMEKKQGSCMVLHGGQANLTKDE